MMHSAHFQLEMKKIIECFGKNHYPEARVNLIHRECSTLDGDSFTRVVSKLIGECRYAPLLPEFREACIVEREKSNANLSKQHTRDSREFWKSSGQSTASEEEQGWMFEAIRNRIQNNMNDSDWAAFMKLIDTRFGKQAS
jgi:hypothetical protein